MDSILWQNNTLALLDQSRLPRQEAWVECAYYRQVAQAIEDGVVLGTSSVAVAAAYGYCLAASELAQLPDFLRRMAKARQELEGLHPCRERRAALDRMEECLNQYLESTDLLLALNAQAVTIHRQDVIANRTISRVGAQLVGDGASLLTLGSTGALATGGVGTALGVVRGAQRAGKVNMVYIVETRPACTGARLSAWELQRDGIPVTVAPDAAAASLMKAGKVDMVLAGCTGMAANGDFAGVFGTYALAVAAYFHGVPFFAVLPSPAVDLAAPDGAALPQGGMADEPAGAEALGQIPDGAVLWTPAKELTPAQLVTGVITEKGVVFPPYGENLARLFS